MVEFDPGKDRFLRLNLNSSNKKLRAEIFSDIDAFSQFVNDEIEQSSCRYAIGGYNEYRDIYSRSAVFDGNNVDAEPRRRHLGLDIWGKAGTIVYCPVDAVVHSTGTNMAIGDYGATVILQHQLDDIIFHTLYGHVSLDDLNLKPGTKINGGQMFAHFGEPFENGHWPPHLHFQIIIDMEDKTGDYPGVCRESEKTYYLENCPDPDLIADMNRYGIESIMKD
ncbi:peptidoglycan DD-metalloendopeptidase family protein [Pollutibacter soli]|uniref:peptidoglycan DD-metalloendopeptidase family protein n=1 Tax=Pollutibacter soli TaxID=3034157 RepID=UPI003013B384